MTPRRATPLTTRKTGTLTTEGDLLAVLERARAVGFLGPGPFRAHRDHARAFGRHVPADAARLIDLGSGGGVPGLPLFVEHPTLSGVLLDAAQKRCSFLVWAVAELDLADRVQVVQGRAEAEAHREDLRASFDVVVCRGFGPPAVTVECAVGYIRDSGRLLISEPPERRAWPTEALAAIGLHEQPRDDADTPIAVFERRGPLDPSLPRTAKQQQRAPLFHLGDQPG